MPIQPDRPKACGMPRMPVPATTHLCSRKQTLRLHCECESISKATAIFIDFIHTLYLPKLMCSIHCEAFGLDRCMERYYRVLQPLSSPSFVYTIDSQYRLSVLVLPFSSLVATLEFGSILNNPADVVAVASCPFLERLARSEKQRPTTFQQLRLASPFCWCQERMKKNKDG